MTSLHLLVAISSHGYGHLAQAAPVVNALRKRLPELRVTVRTGIPRPLLEARIEGDFALQAEADDFGMRQLSAFDVDVEASAAAYRHWHDEWQRRVDGVAVQLRASAPDLVFADVPYLTLAAAQRAELPAVALCSLNWLEIYRHYCGKRPEAPSILDAMTSAYGSARIFLRPTPSMPMEGLTNAREIGPIAQNGSDRRAELNEA